MNDVQYTEEMDITVEETRSGPPALEGYENPPTDKDGDGQYEDVNGDGEFTVADVQAYFQKRESDVVQNNSEYFNFDQQEPPAVSIRDVQALFQEYLENS